jgi:hypothetical protein
VSGIGAYAPRLTMDALIHGVSAGMWQIALPNPAAAFRTSDEAVRADLFHFFR